jgi:hypothetical protein
MIGTVLKWGAIIAGGIWTVNAGRKYYLVKSLVTLKVQTSGAKISGGKARLTVNVIVNNPTSYDLTITEPKIEVLLPNGTKAGENFPAGKDIVIKAHENTPLPAQTIEFSIVSAISTIFSALSTTKPTVKVTVVVWGIPISTSQPVQIS